MKNAIVYDPRLSYLFQRHIAQKTSYEEKQELLYLMGLLEHEEQVIELINDAWQHFQPTGSPFSSDQSEALLNKIILAKEYALDLETEKAGIVRSIFQNWKWVAAAAIIVFIAGGYLIFKNNNRNSEKGIAKQEERFKNNIKAPQSNIATITLADGSVIVLNDKQTGSLATEGDVNVVKTADGVVYQSEVVSPQSTVKYNTLTNPRGSKVISLTLQDGTKVFLNSESSLKYPAAFTGNERMVEITGEAFFEVAHDASKPFKVNKGAVVVTVLGTHFNVNAYDDEPEIKVTLLEGSVKVNRQSAPSTGSGSVGSMQSAILKPGQQALINPSAIQLVNNPDLIEVMSWKNGKFYFDGTDIRSIMNQIKRWYNVDVSYSADINELFVANISRNVSISEFLNLLEMTNLVHFKIEGNKVTVMK